MADGKLKVAPNGKLGRPHADFRFGPRDFRFTVGKDGALYAFCMTVPAPDTELRITSLGTDAGLLSAPIRSVKLLGSSATLEWRQRADGLVVRCPSGMPFESAIGFRVGS
jgi:alpha-L-fucosidase